MPDQLIEKYGPLILSVGSSALTGLWKIKNTCKKGFSLHTTHLFLLVPPLAHTPSGDDEDGHRGN